MLAIKNTKLKSTGLRRKLDRATRGKGGANYQRMLVEEKVTHQSRKRKAGVDEDAYNSKDESGDHSEVRLSVLHLFHIFISVAVAQ